MDVDGVEGGGEVRGVWVLVSVEYGVQRGGVWDGVIVCYFLPS